MLAYVRPLRPPAALWSIIAAAATFFFTKDLSVANPTSIVLATLTGAIVLVCRSIIPGGALMSTASSLVGAVVLFMSAYDILDLFIGPDWPLWLIAPILMILGLMGADVLACAADED